MAKYKDSKMSLEEEVKTLKKHMGRLVVTVTDLKKTVEVLEKKVSFKKNEEIKEMLEAKKVVDEVIAANASEIKRLECEIDKIRITKSDNVVSDKPTAKDKILLKVHNDKDRKEAEKNNKETKNKAKVCRYFNRGYCKYKFKCRFIHTKEICEEFIKTQNCTRTVC